MPLYVPAGAATKDARGTVTSTKALAPPPTLQSSETVFAPVWPVKAVPDVTPTAAVPVTASSQATVYAIGVGTGEEKTTELYHLASDSVFYKQNFKV